MNFQMNELYHIYNRGNNKQNIFFSETNYLYFLEKVRKHIMPVCDILNFCLMPNHFHFLIYASEKTVQTKLIGQYEKNILSEGFKNLLSSYCQAINKQNKTTGSLFQQNTKAKCLSHESVNYGTICFHYIHQNPLKAGMVKKMEDWKFSSFPDFAGLRSGTLCNKELAFKLLDLNKASFYKDSTEIAGEDLINIIY